MGERRSASTAAGMEWPWLARTRVSPSSSTVEKRCLAKHRASSRTPLAPQRFRRRQPNAVRSFRRTKPSARMARPSAGARCRRTAHR
eukprot:1306335-Alexandrium_andersonii.AAC.1